MVKNIVILISGRGSNMQALVEAQIPNARIAAVLSNRPDAAGLDWARERGIAVDTVDHRTYHDRDAFEQALAETIDRYQPDLVVLAGFMRILGAAFVEHYANRLLNIHPSLLPAFPGLHTHQRAIDAGCRIAGCTVHLVTPALDHGPIIAQAAVPVLANDDADTLAARVLREEHRLYPLAVGLFSEGRLRIQGMRVLVADEIPADGALSVPATTDGRR